MLECVKKCAGRNLEKEVEIQMAYITCKDLTLGYEGHAIVSDLNFKVSKGDYLCIVGENGTGKSTLIKTLLHLQDAISGDIITGDGLKAYEVGYLPQQTVVQKDFPATVEEIVLSGTLAKCGWRPFYRKAEKKLAEEKMKRMEVWNLRKSCYRNLSGGQQQRTLLARALCAASKVILLDEPVTGLDPKVTAEFYQVRESLSSWFLIMYRHLIMQHISFICKRKTLFMGQRKNI